MLLHTALGKIAGTKAYIAEDGSRPQTFHWFDILIEKRKSLGFQKIGYDAVPDEDYLIISQEVTTDIPEDVPKDELDRENPATVDQSSSNEEGSDASSTSQVVPMIPVEDGFFGDTSAFEAEVMGKNSDESQETNVGAETPADSNAVEDQAMGRSSEAGAAETEINVENTVTDEVAETVVENDVVTKEPVYDFWNSQFTDHTFHLG